MKYLFERQFLTDDSLLDDDEVGRISQQVAALSVADCANTVTQLLTYFDAYVRQLKAEVSYIVNYFVVVEKLHFDHIIRLFRVCFV